MCYSSFLKLSYLSNETEFYNNFENHQAQDLITAG